jgi:hypothetical protein
MFDVNLIKKRYFKLKINGIVVELSPPKIKVLKKITSLSKGAEDAQDGEVIEDLTEAVKLMLSNNKAKTKIPDELVEDLDFDELVEILKSYFTWLKNTKNNPN